MSVPSRCFLVLLVAGVSMPAEGQEAEPGLTLPPIVVTANRVPTSAAEVGSAVTVITRQELEDRQIRQLSDALREVAGVAVNRTGPAGQTTQIRIRGSESNQTLVLIDGVEVNDPSSESEFDFAHLMADDIERIEVLRGPQRVVDRFSWLEHRPGVTPNRVRGTLDPHTLCSPERECRISIGLAGNYESGRRHFVSVANRHLRLA